MARNPYGEVALGQEGSGLAQIFTPYDATKFDRAVVASGEEQKKEDAKAAKEIKPIEVDIIEAQDYWNTMAYDYTKPFDDLLSEGTELSREAIEVSSITDLKEKQRRTNELAFKNAEYNSKKESYKNNVLASTKQREIWRGQQSTWLSNQDKYSEESAYRLNEFTNLNDNKQLVNKLGVEKARA